MSVTTTCYGRTREWTTREEALAFFLDGAYACEGAERDRYARIAAMLADGCDHAYDGGME